MRVLFMGCHPDDVECYAGGTVRKYVEQGAEVYTGHVANGCQGHVVIEPKPLAEIRAKEAEAAGKLLGAKEVFNLDIDDMTVACHDPAVMDAMADIVRYVRPDVIFTHNPQDYMLDHQEASIIVTNGSFVSGISHRPRKYEPFNSFVPVFFMDTDGGVNFQPTHYVDITEQEQRKLDAVACHESQIKWLMDHDGIDFLETVKLWDKYRGYQCGVKAAEGFRPYNVYPRYSTKNLLPD